MEMAELLFVVVDYRPKYGYVCRGFSYKYRCSNTSHRHNLEIRFQHLKRRYNGSLLVVIQRYARLGASDHCLVSTLVVVVRHAAWNRNGRSRVNAQSQSTHVCPTAVVETKQERCPDGATFNIITEYEKPEGTWRIDFNVSARHLSIGSRGTRTASRRIYAHKL